MVGFFKEAVELRVMGDALISEAAKINQRRIGLKKSHERWDGFEAFQGSDQKCTQQCMLTGAVSADAPVEFR